MVCRFWNLFTYKMKRLFVILTLLGVIAFGHSLLAGTHFQYVDPFIGTGKGKGGLGNVTIGPSCPFGMIKPGPDNNKESNSGYLADTLHPVYGFSQTHGDKRVQSATEWGGALYSAGRMDSRFVCQRGQSQSLESVRYPYSALVYGMEGQTRNIESQSNYYRYCSYGCRLAARSDAKRMCRSAGSGGHRQQVVNKKRCGLLHEWQVSLRRERQKRWYDKRRVG